MSVMTPDPHFATEYGAAVAAEVRAEMGRQRKTQAELAQILGITAATAARRLDGSVPFDVIELLLVGTWLGRDPRSLMPFEAEVVAS